ncbi:60S ribosomal protein L37a [Polytolypa hystricis UAMH7299]|uniref:60S ribosomal protein L37a n=1 Tax=Polytolypa hystricis (strain UAMH7299) TaxID=1447883 RepID=A0A2B7YRE5_POLH7|nr:60S ribosomal protein L37a [Polytolypa hystricis UAMH7299]
MAHRKMLPRIRFTLSEPTILTTSDFDLESSSLRISLTASTHQARQDDEAHKEGRCYRYGASLRKQVKKMEISQHARYTCTFCGKDSVKRLSVGIWECKSCKKTVAGGAWTVSTPAAAATRSTIRRLREIAEV